MEDQEVVRISCKNWSSRLELFRLETFYILHFLYISQTLSANYAFFAKKNFAKGSDNDAEFREDSKMCENVFFFAKNLLFEKTKVQGN